MSKSSMIENITNYIVKLQEIQLSPSTISNSNLKKNNKKQIMAKRVIQTPKSEPPKASKRFAAIKSPLPKSRSETPIGMKKKKSNQIASSPIIIEMSGLSTDQRQLIKDYHDKIGKERSVKLSLLNQKFTHLVISTDKDGYPSGGRTIKYLLGILNGAYIVSFGWFLSSLSEKSWQEESVFLVKGSLSPLHRSLGFGKIKNGPFHEKSFYISGSFNDGKPRKQNVIDLIKAGGGRIITRRPIVTKDDDNVVIICGSNLEEAKGLKEGNPSLPSSPFPSFTKVHDWNWLIESILNYNASIGLE